MVKYYIRISETEPLPSDNGLCFEVTTEQGGENNVFVLSKDEYNSVVNEFNTIKNHFEEEYVQPIVEREVTDYMDVLAGNVENATYLKQQNGNNKYDYDTLKSLFDSKLNISNVDSSLSLASSNPVQNNVLKTELDGKAPTDHTHDNRYYTETEINDKLNWKKLTLSNMSGCNLYYNSLFCHFTFNAKYSVSTTGQYVKLVTGTIPNGYRPRVVVTTPNDGNMQIRMKITEGGEFMVDTPSKLSSTPLRGSITWARNLP